MAAAPVFIPNVSALTDLNQASYEFITELINDMELEYSIFGPQFENRVEDYCEMFYMVKSISYMCDDIVDSADPVEGYDAMSTKLLQHYAQI